MGPKGHDKNYEDFQIIFEEVRNFLKDAKAKFQKCKKKRKNGRGRKFAECENGRGTKTEEVFKNGRGSFREKLNPEVELVSSDDVNEVKAKCARPTIG